MALTAFCTICQRTVYVDSDATPVCPVCSSPLLEAAPVEVGESEGQNDDEGGNEESGDGQPGGAK